MSLHEGRYDQSNEPASPRKVEGCWRGKMLDGRDAGGEGLQHDLKMLHPPLPPPLLAISFIAVVFPLLCLSVCML